MDVLERREVNYDSILKTASVISTEENSSDSSDT
jgi:hypothetical protein